MSGWDPVTTSPYVSAVLGALGNSSDERGTSVVFRPNCLGLWSLSLTTNGFTTVSRFVPGPSLQRFTSDIDEVSSVSGLQADNHDETLIVSPVVRVRFPQSGPYSGETHGARGVREALGPLQSKGEVRGKTFSLLR